MIRFAALAALVTLTACNTVQGVGRDVQQTGAAIQNAVR